MLPPHLGDPQLPGDQRRYAEGAIGGSDLVECPALQHRSPSGITQSYSTRGGNRGGHVGQQRQPATRVERRQDPGCPAGRQGRSYPGRRRSDAVSLTRIPDSPFVVTAFMRFFTADTRFDPIRITGVIQFHLDLRPPYGFKPGFASEGLPARCNRRVASGRQEASRAGR